MISKKEIKEMSKEIKEMSKNTNMSEKDVIKLLDTLCKPSLDNMDTPGKFKSLF